MLNYYFKLCIIQVDIIDELLGDQWPFLPEHQILKDIENMETARREENELLLLKEENVQDLNNKKEKPIVNDSNNSEREILKLKVNVYIYITL